MDFKLMLATSIASALAAELLFTAQLPMAAPVPQSARFPRLREALAELREARSELQKAPVDFGGRRNTALRAIDSADASIRTILQYRDGDPLPTRVGHDEVYRTYRDYPRLRHVLHDLREAREELEDAKADVGNLKERALADIQVAVREVKALARWADDNRRR